MSNPRSGSKSIMALLQSVFGGLNYYTISEPFNIHHHVNMGTYTHDFFKRILKEDNVIIKTLVDQKPEKYENIDEWYSDIFRIFNKVILLDRKDKKLQSESYSYWKEKGEFGRWHVPSVYDLSNISEKIISKNIELLSKQSNVLSNLHIKYNVPLFFYEDIFLNKNDKFIDEIFNYLEILKNEFYVNKFIYSNDLKVRLEKTNKKLY